MRNKKIKEAKIKYGEKGVAEYQFSKINGERFLLIKLFRDKKKKK